MAGFETNEIGIILAGSAEAAKITKSGAQFTVLQMRPGAVYGDVLAGSHTKSPVTITAKTDCRVMLLSYLRLFAIPTQAEGLFRRLLANLLEEIADKYFLLDARLDLLLQKGLRQRIAAYLLSEETTPGTVFEIPFSRASLAHYLGCERSALSREISRMAGEGLLEIVDRRSFRLLAPEELRILL